jgi:AcrR family transcriptional regulator
MRAKTSLRDHVATAIIASATRVLTEPGEQATMADIAIAAGVSRPTLYRYFPNREAVVHAIFAAALEDVDALIAHARLSSVPVPQAVARLSRAMIGAMSRHHALGRLEKTPEDHRRSRQHLLAPVKTLLRRGVREKLLSSDLKPDVLAETYLALVSGLGRRVAAGGLGVEDASEAATAIFLHGALRR